VDLAEKYSKKLRRFNTNSPDIQKYKGGFTKVEKDLEQSHMIFGFEGVPHKSSDRFDFVALSTIIGGGMSSRLFQEVREKRGLAYSIFSYVSNYKDSGIFGIYAGSDEYKLEEVCKVIHSELSKVQENLKEEEVHKAKIQIKASLLMGLENSSTRMERIANQYLLHGSFFTNENLIKLIDEVSVTSILKSLEKMQTSKPTLAIVGKCKSIDNLYRIFK
jgi:predicted Zn-dependent peptidase